MPGVTRALEFGHDGFKPLASTVQGPLVVGSTMHSSANRKILSGPPNARIRSPLHHGKHIYAHLRLQERRQMLLKLRRVL